MVRSRFATSPRSALAIRSDCVDLLIWLAEGERSPAETRLSRSVVDSPRLARVRTQISKAPPDTIAERIAVAMTRQYTGHVMPGMRRMTPANRVRQMKTRNHICRALD